MLVISHLTSTLLSVVFHVVDLLQAVDGGLHSGCSSGSKLPSPARDLLAAGLCLALEDTARRAPDAVLAAEHAVVLGALQDLIALDNLPQRGAIARAVLAGDSDLLGVLGHCLNWGRRNWLSLGCL